MLTSNEDYPISDNDCIDLSKKMPSFDKLWKSHFQYHPDIEEIIKRTGSGLGEDVRDIVKHLLESFYGEVIFNNSFLEEKINKKIQMVANEAYWEGIEDAGKDLTQRANLFKKDVERYMKQRDGY